MARLEIEEVVALEPDDGFLPWYVSWSGVFVGALSALALLLVFGLTGIAIGAHQVGQRYASWHEFRLITLVFSVFGSFLSFVLGGWAAARVTGTRRVETAMLHGAIAWLVTVPGLLFFAGLGAGGPALAAGGEEGGTVRSTSAADVAIQLSYARLVVVVPGYGMAVAQAQRAVADLPAALERRNV